MIQYQRHKEILDLLEIHRTLSIRFADNLRLGDTRLCVKTQSDLHVLHVLHGKTLGTKSCQSCKSCLKQDEKKDLRQ